ncbi:MAG: 5-(carboxyamino)imidazole ribonucleotide mutase [Candidatus Omnitrophica bacterium]|nr:5-(carboxyamino)imidazole ribonucleotide mutase [Candidatus Omnitrophota bacterium]
MGSRIRIIMGSQSDLETVDEAIKVLKEFKEPFEARVLSAHRTPKDLIAYIRSAENSGAKVFIAAAGGAAALAGVVAAHTCLPVIGIPIETKSLKGLDSLLSTVQMPPGIPVATMGIGKAGAKNAALCALSILGASDVRLRSRIAVFRKSNAAKIRKIRLKV